jgi:hypothetical protein
MLRKLERCTCAPTVGLTLSCSVSRASSSAIGASAVGSSQVATSDGSSLEYSRSCCVADAQRICNVSGVERGQRQLLQESTGWLWGWASPYPCRQR